MKTYKEVATEIIISYFENMATQDILSPHGFAEIYEIKHDDKVLLEHIEALINIFTKAKEEIESKGE